MPPLIEVTEPKGTKRSPCAVLDDEDRNFGAVFLGNQRDFAHSSAPAAGGVKHRRAQQFGKRKVQHVFENTQLKSKNPLELCSAGVPPAREAGNARQFRATVP